MSYSQSYVNNLNNQISSLQSQVNSLQSNVNSLTSTRNSLRTKLASLKTEKIELEKELASLQTQNATNIEKIKELNAIIVSKNAEIESLNTEIRQRDNEIDSLQREIEEREQEIVHLNGVVVEKNAYIQELELKIVEREQQILTLQAEKGKFQVQVALKTEEIKVVSNAESQTRVDLEMEISSYLDKISASQKRIKILSDELNSIRAILKSVYDDNRKYDLKLKILVDEQIHLKNMYDSLSIEYRDAIITIETLRESSARAAAVFEQVISGLNAQISDITDRYNVAAAEVAKLKDEVYKIQTICPNFINGTVAVSVIDPTAQKYFVDQGTLRPISDQQYRELGNPVIKTYETLENCTIGGGLVPKIEQTIYTIVSARDWDDSGNLIVLRENGQKIELVNFTRSESSAFVVGKNGHIRSIRNGNFLGDNNCSLPIISTKNAAWQLIQLDHQYKFALKSRCGKFLETTDHGLELSNVRSSGFYLIPSGTVRVPIDES